MELKKRIRSLLRCAVVSVVLVAAVGCAPGGVYVGVVVPGPWVAYPPGVMPPPYAGRQYPGYRYDNQLDEQESGAGMVYQCCGDSHHCAAGVKKCE